MTIDEQYMARCLQLAANGRFDTAPNPMVGAVIVHHGKIIGEGYHRRCGEAHAEVNAVSSVKDESLLREATMYVSLEPCAHYGKTPPCADLIVSKHIPRVVIGCRDNFDQVDGKGIQKLRDAGIEVTVGVLEEECRALNRAFFTYHGKRRPYIILKWAQSADGYIDKNRAERTDGPAVRFSTDETSMSVHRLRALSDAILVGRRTASLDNPSLTTRLWPGKSPLRVVIDRKGILDLGLKIFDGTTKTAVFTDVFPTRHTAASHRTALCKQDTTTTCRRRFKTSTKFHRPWPMGRSIHRGGPLLLGQWSEGASPRQRISKGGNQSFRAQDLALFTRKIGFLLIF